MLGVSAIKVVAFDVGETLIDESRIWLRWAERLQVPPATLMGAIGAMAVQDLPLVKAFDIVKPGIDLEAEQAAWAIAEPDSLRAGFDIADLYPDVIPALSQLRDNGYRVIVSGNQPSEATPALTAMNLPAHAIVNSAEIGVEKPAAGFFTHLIELADCSPGEIAYVGDRLDNDVLAAQRYGINPVFIRRGPWGFLHADRAVAAGVPVIDSLLELPAVLENMCNCGSSSQYRSIAKPQ